MVLCSITVFRWFVTLDPPNWLFFVLKWQNIGRFWFQPANPQKQQCSGLFHSSGIFCLVVHSSQASPQWEFSVSVLFAVRARASLIRAKLTLNNTARTDFHKESRPPELQQVEIQFSSLSYHIICAQHEWSKCLESVFDIHISPSLTINLWLTEAFVEVGRSPSNPATMNTRNHL